MESYNKQEEDKMFAGAYDEHALSIKVIGVGGAGTNAADHLKLGNKVKAEFAAVNTDAQSLASSPIGETCLIGRTLTRGLSAGGEAEIGRKAALGDRDKLTSLVSGSRLVFVLAGLGGGTGGGAAPVLAEIASEQGALVIAFVTLPFTIEGGRKQSQAYESLAELRQHCDAVIPLSNDMLLQQIPEDSTVLDAFCMVDNWISQGVASVCSMISNTGLINLDLSSLRRAFAAKGGKTLFSLGSGEGENYAQKAIDDLMMCPLLHLPESARNADKLLINLIGGPGMGLAEVNEIVSKITARFKSANETAIGAVIDDRLKDSIEICVIGTSDINSEDSLPKRSRIEVKTVSPVVCLDQQAMEGTGEVQVAKGTGEVQVKQIESAPESELQQKTKFNVHQSKLEEKTVRPPIEIDQEEFGFAGKNEQRGYFDDTEKSLYEGQDLDVPTFLRMGIKISL